MGPDYQWIDDVLRDMECFTRSNLLFATTFKLEEARRVAKKEIAERVAS